MGGSIGTLTGKVQVHVHYFEDGNVQLDDKVVFQSELPASAEEVGGAFAKKVKECEQGLLAKLEETYTSMSDNVLQGLRRRLPITKTKFDWDKVAISKLAADLQSAAGMNISYAGFGWAQVTPRCSHAREPGANRRGRLARRFEVSTWCACAGMCRVRARSVDLRRQEP